LTKKISFRKIVYKKNASFFLELDVNKIVNKGFSDEN